MTHFRATAAQRFASAALYLSLLQLQLLTASKKARRGLNLLTESAAARGVLRRDTQRTSLSAKCTIDRAQRTKGDNPSLSSRWRVSLLFSAPSLFRVHLAGAIFFHGAHATCYNISTAAFSHPSVQLRFFFRSP